MPRLTGSYKRILISRYLNKMYYHWKPSNGNLCGNSNRLAVILWKSLKKVSSQTVKKFLSSVIFKIE